MRGTFWIAVGNVVLRGLGFLAAIFVARILGREGFGQIGMLQSTVGMLQTFAGFGLGLTVTKFAAEYRASDPARAGRIIGFSDLTALIAGSVMTALLLLGAGWICTHSLHDSSFAPVLRISAPLLFLSAVNGAQLGTLAGLEAFRETARLNMISGCVSFVSLVIAAQISGVRGYAAAMVLNQLLVCVLGQLAVRKQCAKHGISPRFRGAFSEAGLLWTFSIPALLSAVLIGPPQWIVNAMLVRLPGGYSEMGLLSAATQFRTLLVFVPMMLVQATLPVMSSAGDDERSHHRAFGFTNSLVIAFGLPFAALVMFSSDYLLRLYGRGFETGAAVVIGMALLALQHFISAGVGSMMEARARMWLAFRINLLSATFYVVSVYFTVARYKAAGVAMCCALSFLINNAGCFLCMRSQLPPHAMRRFMTVSVFGLVLAMSALASGPLRPYLALPFVFIAFGFSIAATDVPVSTLLQRALGRAEDAKLNLK